MRTALILLICSLVPWGAHASESTIHLGVGTQKVLSVPGGVSRVAVGDPNVADVKPLGSNQMLIVGGQVGRTTLLVWRTSGARDSYSIVVRSVSIDETAAEIRTLLGEVEGIVVHAVGDRVLLDGEALTAEDYQRAKEVVSVYPGAHSFVKLSPGARKQVARNLEGAFAEAGLPHVHAMVAGATIFLEGSVESEQDLEKAMLIAQAHGQKVENLLTVGIKKMILSDVHFVEVRRATLQNYGLRLPTDLAGAVTMEGQIEAPIPGLAPASGGIVTGLLVNGQTSLRLAVDSGAGRLLAQPSLVCASGGSAEFLAGGEVPVPLITQTSASVSFHKYGILLRIRPTADRFGNIETVIEAEVSELDRSVAVAVGSSVAVPGFRSRSVKTNVTVRDGETIVLSGVFSHDQQKAVAKVPVLAHLPVIGELFKQRSIDDAQRELVIFVTPRVVTPQSAQIQNMIEEKEENYREAERDVKFRLLD